jgi:hypothetical protein
MPRFLYLLFPPLTDADTPPLLEWVARQAARGVVRSGARVAPGTRLGRGDGVTTVGDADPLWGFLVVEAEDARAALAIAAACPGTDPGTIDLYPLDLGNAIGEALADAATLR